MHPRLKERLVGAAVLVVLAVIFIPMILTGPVDTGAIDETNIPAQPADTFKPTLVPITEAGTPAVEPETIAETIAAPPAKTETPPVQVSEQVAVEQVANEPAVESASQAQNIEPKQEPVATSKQDKASTDKPVGLSAWVVQLGSFTSKVNADKMNLSLRKAGYPAFVEPLSKDNKTSYRVRVGPELLRSDAEKLLKSINEKMQLKGIVLRYP